MSSAFLLIDGYNLLHDAGLARATYGPGDLARQRLELLNKLSKRLSTDERKRCTVVFDAIDAPKNLARRFSHQGMIVLFAEPGHEADEVIEELIIQHSAPRRLTVVSSDHRLQNAIRRRRGIGLDSDVFLKQLDSPDRQIGESTRSASAGKDANRELDFWMQEFDDLNPDALNTELLIQSGEKKSDWERDIDQLQQKLKDPGNLDDWLNESPGQKPPRKPT